MAGEQDKEAKKKTTLIKHRKEDGAPALPAGEVEHSSEGRIKVVKKKMVVKVRNPADQKAGDLDSASGDATTRAASTDGKASQSEHIQKVGKPVPARSSRPQESSEVGSGDPNDKSRDYSSKQGVVGGRYVGPARQYAQAPRPDADRSNERKPAPEAGAERSFEKPAASRDGPEQPAIATPPADKPVRPAYDRSPYQTPGFQPSGYQGQNPNPNYRGQGSGYQGQNPNPNYQGQGGYRPGPGAPRGPGGPSGPGGPGGDNRGPRPGYAPRTGGPGGPGGPNRGGPGGRPGYGPRPGGSSGGFGQRPGPAQSTPIEAGKVSSKKFVKAKKPATYNKRDRTQEKELQFKQKKNQVKTNPIPKSIDIMEVVTVAELARKMNLKASDLISKLFGMGMMVTINQQIDAETATILAGEYDCHVNIVSLYDETLIEAESGVEEDVVLRPPVVTIMGHVDHGKTKLLDAIRSADVAAGESGGITQHIGAYQVATANGKITFIDTPGHEAFTAMRARGAQVTDLVILVVAANDGVMPQTVEAIQHAQEGKVPIIVAVNKVDLPDANMDRVKQQLSEYGILADDWGGHHSFFPISALKKIGLQELLDGILLQAEVMELKTNSKCRAEGRIVESRIDQGRGIVATALVQRGELRIGDSFVAGIYPGKVRAMFNDKGERIEVAGPATPVEVLGFTGIPEAGDPFQVTESDKYAREIGEKRQELKKVEIAKNVKRITLDNLYDSIKLGEVKELKVVIKGDVHGSVEAIKTSLEKLSTREIGLSVITAAAGAINESDVMLAAASNAIIIGFHVRPSVKAQVLADQEKVEIRKYSIIYDVVEDIKTAMEGLLAPEFKEEQLATVEVREVFKVPKLGTIAGSYITKGSVKRNAMVHLVREGIEIYTGKIVSLRRFKEDVKQAEAGFECGIGLEGFSEIMVGDQLEVFEMKEIARKLGQTLIEEAAEVAKKKDKA